MDDLYSLSLLIALVGGGVEVAAFALRLKAGSPPPWRSRLGRVCLVGGVASVLLGFLSALVHLRFGYGSGSPVPMTAIDFFLHHRAYGVILALSLASFAGWLGARRARRSPG